MQRGDTFLVTEPGSELDNHLLIVVSDPDQSDDLLCINFTTHTPLRDQACIVEPHEHDWLTVKSCIYYERPWLLKSSELHRMLEKGLIEKRAKCSDELLYRIYAGALASKRLLLRYADLLESQGLIQF